MQEGKTMADLKKAMSIPGAFAAGEFSPTGELISYVGSVSLQAAKIAAQMCAANMLMFKMQASGWTAYTGKEGFEPARGFAVSGPENSALIVGNVGVFVRNKDADFDKAFEVLASL
jgi:roadblock/LC7 domain-containing protein